MTGTLEQIQRIEAELIRRAEEAGPGKGLLGSHVGLVVRTLQPDFQPQAYGVRTLREFIERYVPSIKVIGYSGLDPIYGVPTSTSEPLPQPPSSGGYDLWRVWSSPASPLAIAVKRATGETRAVPREQAGAEDEVQILPASFELHRSLATEFLKTHETLPEAVSAVLRQTLDDPKGAWWRRWFEILRDFPEINQNWLAYRRRGLESALQASLRSAGLESMQVDRACREVTTRTRGVGRRPGIVGDTTAGGLPEAVAATRRTELVGLVQAVVARMGDNELRSLSLPVGLILDVLMRGHVGR